MKKVLIIAMILLTRTTVVLGLTPIEKAVNNSIFESNPYLRCTSILALYYYTNYCNINIYNYYSKYIFKEE